jgi:hypothetical protein
MQRAQFEKDFLGKGFNTPIRRQGGGDYVAATGVNLVRSAIRQILNTDKGELPWRPNFGTTIRRYKHKLLNQEFDAVVRSEIESAIKSFEPRVELVAVQVVKRDTRAIVTIRWQVIETNVPGNNVLLGPDTVEVSV